MTCYRLSLRPLLPTDAGRIAELCNTLDISKWYLPPLFEYYCEGVLTPPLLFPYWVVVTRLVRMPYPYTVDDALVFINEICKRPNCRIYAMEIESLLMISEEDELPDKFMETPYLSFRQKCKSY